MPTTDNRVWYHIILSTYGSWLPGDPRGFRTRRHREHVEGDYKNPPPSEKYAARRKASRTLLKHPSVVLPNNFKAIIGNTLLKQLEQLGAFVLCISVGGQHVHILVKTPRDTVREFSGTAKAHAWHAARQAGWTAKLWAKLGKYKPIRDRQHQLNTYYYILDHAKEGAWIWRWHKTTEDVSESGDGNPR